MKKEKMGADQLAALGLTLVVASLTVGLLALELPPDASGAPMALFIAFPNFYVITRYNKSRLYAAAVTSLAEALRAAYTGAPAPTVGMR